MKDLIARLQASRDQRKVQAGQPSKLRKMLDGIKNRGITTESQDTQQTQTTAIPTIQARISNDSAAPIETQQAQVAQPQQTPSIAQLPQIPTIVPETQSAQAAQIEESQPAQQATVSPEIAKMLEDMQLSIQKTMQENMTAITAKVQELAVKPQEASEISVDGEKKEAGPMFITALIPKICEEQKIPRENHELVFSYLRDSGYDFTNPDEQGLSEAIKATTEKYPILSRSANLPDVTGSRAKQKPVDYTNMGMKERNAIFKREAAKLA